MPSVACTAHDDSRYEVFLKAMRDHFDKVTNDTKALFTTASDDLFDVFLDHLPAEEKQHHTCHACRDFVRKYGGLVTIDDEGVTLPVMWGLAPGFYAKAFGAVGRVVEKAKVTGVFLSRDKVWGQPVTGDWHHMAVTPPGNLMVRRSMLTPGQMMAEKREDYGMLQRGLADFSREAVAQALRVLDADALYRSEKALGVAKWMVDLHAARDGKRGKAKDHVTWLAVATAPPGFCHVRSTMISTLLEDIVAGLPFGDISRKWADKMAPLQYQRPQAPPSAGNIAQAEKIVAELGSAGALTRRFARLEDVQSLWSPKAIEPTAPTGSVFGHLEAKGTTKIRDLELPATAMTWVRFAAEVLPTVESAEYMVPYGSGPYIALVTAVDPDATPILQWDTEERRNPVNWYVYPGGSSPRDWNLQSEVWAKVNAVCLMPHMWHVESRHSHQGEGAILILDGCRDLRPRGGLALFPEVLKTEYRAVRATIEAYSRGAEIAHPEDSTACGVDLRKGNERWNHTVRVRASGSWSTYTLDRWE